jgi:16S rRNA (cytosine1402-N4)-methyltransferase
VNPPLHIPVLLDDVTRVLDPRPGETLVDCTVGLGGHSAALARFIGQGGRIIGFDLDPRNLAEATTNLRAAGPAFTPIQDSFVRVKEHLERLNLQADLVLADLGFSSSQVDDPERGFSFLADGPLDMRLDPSGPVTAADLVNRLSEQELANVIFTYGEEPLARVIARKVEQARTRSPIRMTAQLAQVVREAYGRRAHASRMHPATRTFMALRIAVNDEIAALQALLDSIAHAAGHGAGRDWLSDGARVAVISFHSLEDRMVKRAFADLVKRQLATGLTKKPLTATEQEQHDNPRSRSAKLRAIKIGRGEAPTPGKAQRIEGARRGSGD